MADQPLRYEEVRRSLAGAAVRHVLRRGNGAPLVFFWVLGAGLLLALSAPLLAAAYSAACGALLVPIIRDGLRDPATRQSLVRDLVDRRFPVAGVRDDGLRTRLAKSTEALTEMAMRVEDLERRGKPSDTLAGVFADAAGLVALQHESATQAEELERVLAFVGAGRTTPDAGSAGATQGEDRRLRAENEQAVLDEARAARELTATIGERLDTMLLQSFRIERETIDLVRADEAARESHEAVKRLQDVVDARRSAARRLAGMLSPDEERYAGDRG
jgi:hypothetical protein